MSSLEQKLIVYKKCERLLKITKSKPARKSLINKMKRYRQQIHKLGGEV